MGSDSSSFCPSCSPRKLDIPRRVKTILVTGGPTRAYLDRVRFLSNISTGSLAYEICRYLKKRGARVVAVIGPSALPFEALGLKRLQRVETTEEMRSAVMALIRKEKVQAGAFSAAVLDFEPVRVHSGKRSSTQKRWTVELKPTAKILDEVGERFPQVVRVGFKLEAEKRTGAEAEKFARRYLRRKGLSALCYNQTDAIGVSHRALWLTADGEKNVLNTKQHIAKVIGDFLLG